MPDFKSLTVWRSAHALVLDVYQQTARFPRHELFGLTAQMRRAAVSIAANIAEGQGRRGDREFARFVTMSLGSVSELEYFLLLAGDLGYLHAPQLSSELASIGRRLQHLRARLLHAE